MISISRNRSGGPGLCALIVAALCIVVFLPRTASADTTTAQLQAAAAKGYVSRQIDLAAAYFVGKGVAQNLKLAAYWYEKAAERAGDPDAQNEIGFLYQTEHWLCYLRMPDARCIGTSWRRPADVSRRK